MWHSEFADKFSFLKQEKYVIIGLLTNLGVLLARLKESVLWRTHKKR